MLSYFGLLFFDTVATHVLMTQDHWTHPASVALVSHSVIRPARRVKLGLYIAYVKHIYLHLFLLRFLFDFL
jgi:hypothetical protein